LNVVACERKILTFAHSSFNTWIKMSISIVLLPYTVPSHVSLYSHSSLFSCDRFVVFINTLLNLIKNWEIKKNWVHSLIPFPLFLSDKYYKMLQKVRTRNSYTCHVNGNKVQPNTMITTTISWNDMSLTSLHVLTTTVFISFYFQFPFSDTNI